MENSCEGFFGLYILSFEVEHNAGLAIVVAQDLQSAISNLRQSGMYNCMPEKYSIIATIYVGRSHSQRYGLIWEGYQDAMVAYEAIADAVRGLTPPTFSIGETEAVPYETGPSVELIEDAETGNYQFVFKLAYGPKGETGESTSVSVGNTTRLEIDAVPTVTERPDASDPNHIYLDFGIPGMTSADVNEWKEDFEEQIAAAMLENERVIANALARHELRLNNL